MVVDDESVSRNIVKHYIEKTPFLSFKYECVSAIDALNVLENDFIDVIFLDVEMPEMSGMELIKSLKEPYEIILITSAKDYAIEAFDHSVTDYLVKPIEYGRFLRAANKAKRNIELKYEKKDSTTDIFVRSDSKQVKIKLADILYIEALADYIIIITESNRFIVHSTMKGIEKRLPETTFSRVHRSYIINQDKIDSLEDMTVIINKKVIPIGASYKDSFLKRLNFL